MGDLNKPSPTPAAPPADDLAVEYANNVIFEPTIWDLKLIFGEFSGRTGFVDWHTSITIPWAQAKLMAYYLTVNIEAHELKNGKIPFPVGMIPTEPQPLPESETKPVARTLFEMLTRNRKKFLDSLEPHCDES
jgi:hypothetical protein